MQVFNGYYGTTRYEVHADTPREAQLKVHSLVQQKFPRRRIQTYDISVSDPHGVTLLPSAGSMS